MAEEQQGGFYRVEVIASLFGVTVRRVQQLTQEGIISTTKTKEGNSYVSQGKCAGARIEFSEDENPVTDILNGKIQFHQYLAPYVPAEDILNILEFDPDMLSAALNGGE